MSGVPRPSYPMIPQATLERMAADSGIPDDLIPPVTNLLRGILDQQALDERLNYQYLDSGKSEICGSLPDELVVDTSGRIYFHTTKVYTKVCMSLNTSGSSTTTVDLEKNGSSLATFSLTSGEVHEDTTVKYIFVSGDYIRFETSVVGTGAKDLVFRLIP